MVNFGYPYNDIVICKDSTDYLSVFKRFTIDVCTFDSRRDTNLREVIISFHTIVIYISSICFGPVVNYFGSG